MPGKTAAPYEIPFSLKGDKPPSIEAATKPPAERIHKLLGEIAPKQITGVAKKQLLIANASGIVTAVTASGDVTNDESGVFTIGGEKVGTTKIANDAVTAAKIAENAVESSEIAAGAVAESELADSAATSRKVKPTVEEKQATETSMALTEAFALIPGLKYEVTPAVASKLLVDFTVVPVPGTSSSFILLNLFKNGAGFYGAGSEIFIETPQNTGFSGAGLVPQHFTLVVPLAAELNVIEIKAKYEGSSGTIKKRGTNMVTRLYAS
jgi:hypothetical protein